MRAQHKAKSNKPSSLLALAYSFLGHLKVPLLMAILLFIIGCADESGTNEPAKKYLITSEKVLEKSTDEINDFLKKTLTSFGASESSLSHLSAFVSSGIEVYKITYATAYQGRTITASGVVALPLSAAPAAMISLQHGTITRFKNAPSEKIRDPDLSFALLDASIASLGFISVVPDYIGFGSSSDILHPYIVAELTATCVVDMLKAAEELAMEKNTNFNGRVLLAGYSEGGYATMATHRYMEQNQIEGLELVASFPAAGGYDVKKMQEYLFLQDTYPNTTYMAYVVHAYKNTFNLTIPLSDIFQAPYAARIPGLFDGSKDIFEIREELTDEVAKLILPEVRANIDTDKRYQDMVNLFEENSLVDWTPKVKMHMYHGKDDLTVPYENSQSVYNTLIANGASPQVVTLIELEGNHSSAYSSYLFDFLLKAALLK